MTAPKKRGPGRPKGTTRPAGSTIGVRLTPDQRAALEKAADGLDLSTWIREIALARAGRSDLGIAGEARRYRNDSRRNGADPNGWNVYRQRGDDEADLDLIAACANRDDALRVATIGDQIQRGLDGAVEVV